MHIIMKLRCTSRSCPLRKREREPNPLAGSGPSKDPGPARTTGQSCPTERHTPPIFTFMLMIRILFSDQYTKDGNKVQKKLISKENFEGKS